MSDDMNRDVSEELIEETLRSLRPDDFERMSPPNSVWDSIQSKLDKNPGESNEEPEVQKAVVLPIQNTPPVAEADRLWFSRPLLVAAAVLVVVGIVGAFLVSSDSAEVLAETSLTDDGLEVSTPATAQAFYACDDGVCSIEIDLTAVPEAQDGVLELWASNADITELHSLGTITQSGTFELPEGVGWKDFPIVDISVEPTDGDPAHSGQSVLRGHWTATDS